MNIVRIGLDLAKYVFHLHGVDERGKVVLRKFFAARAFAIFRKPSTLRPWDGSLERRALLAKTLSELVTTCG